MSAAGALTVRHLKTNSPTIITLNIDLYFIVFCFHSFGFMIVQIILLFLQLFFAAVCKLVRIHVISPTQSHQAAKFCRTKPPSGCKGATRRTNPCLLQSEASSLPCRTAPLGRYRGRQTRRRSLPLCLCASRCCSWGRAGWSGAGSGSGDRRVQSI